MKRQKAIIPAVMMAFGLVALAWTQVSAVAAGARRTLKVKLNYTGTGTVDEKHKIYVLLFDANPFTASTLVDSTSQAEPPAPAAGVSHIVARQGTAGKVLTFREVGISPVFAAAFFDKDGTYNGQSDMASGAPMGIYGKTPGQPEPIKIEEGKTAQIVLAFDDSSKTP